MTKENDLENDLNNLESEINIDRGLELILKHRREPLQEKIKLFCIELKFFKYKITFDISKILQENGPCKEQL